MAEKKILVKTKREVEKKSVKKPLENINSFLYKLWTLVNDDGIPSIHWSQDGEKVVIENPVKFTAKVLVACDKQLFKTKNISSFIRQLNLYGFRRVKDNCGKIPLIFKHESFKEGRPELLVNVKRKKSVPIKPQVNPAVVPIATTKVSKQTIQQNHVPTIPGFSSYPRIQTSQPYSYLNNSIGGKNVPMPILTPFAVNHGPTFINMGPHSTIFSKPRIPARSNDEESTSTEKPESKELYDMKIASEPLHNPWQHKACYNTITPLPDRKTPTACSMVAQNAFVQNHGNYHKYPSTYFNGNIFPIPHFGYRNYGDSADSMSYQNFRHHALPTNPYLPFSSFPAPPFLTPVSLPSSPKTAEQFPKLQEKTETISCASPATSTESKSLESFGIFASRLPTYPTKINEMIISGLTADEEKEYTSDVKE